MTTEQSKQFVAQYIKDIHGKPKTMEMLDQYISDADAELKGHIIVFETGAPCYDFIPDDIIAEGNKVAVRFTITGQHLGDLFGCAPTGNPIHITGIILYELADNMIVNHWMEVDSVGLMQQIGAPVMAA